MMVRAGLKGWTVRPRNLPGNPDFYFPTERLAIFVDGCFWHGCPSSGHVPKTNTAFWHAKMQRNRERDNLTSDHLRERGVCVLRIWEHELDDDVCLQRVIETLTGC
jgi:DNA mismatch endonuclease (patch repair protein)